jgi:hypothetical protein
MKVEVRRSHVGEMTPKGYKGGMEWGQSMHVVPTGYSRDLLKQK